MTDEADRSGSTLESGAAEYRIEEWKPGFGIAIVWTILGTAMTVVGFILFWLVYEAISNGADSSSLVETGSENGAVYFTVQFGGILAVLGATVGVLVLHEAIHGLAFRYFGARPEYGAMMIQKVLPALYCSAPGAYFTRRQMSVILLAPLVIISLAGVALMPVINDTLLLAIPLALNFGGAIGDLWMVGMLVRLAPGTLIEDRKDGLRFHYPPPADSRNLAA